MKKILILFVLFFTTIATAQKMGVDVVKFQGKVTTTVRNNFDVPTGEHWLIFNVTNDRLEIGNDNEVWTEVGGGSGGGSFATLTGLPSENANMQIALDSTVHKFGPESIDGVKTLLQTPNITPPLTTVTDKNTNYQAFSINGTPMFRWQSQYWNGSSFASASSLGIGPGALENNKSRYTTATGKNSGQNNTGESSVFDGDSSGVNNTGNNTLGNGFSSAYNNSGNNGVFNGAYSGYGNTATDVDGSGFYAAASNSGAYSSFKGSRSGQFNTGASSTGDGFYSLIYNSGANSNGKGYYSLQKNIGDNNNGFGAYSLQYASGGNNNVLGNSSYSDFIPNISGNKTFGTGDVNTTTDRIAISAHGFGITNAVVNLKLSGTGVTLGAGMSDGGVNKWKVIDANTIEALFVDITSTGSGTMTFTPQQALSNVNIVGNNLQPTISDQTILGGKTVIAPNSVKADVVAGGNKVLLTREAADQLYTGGGGGGSITLPLDATDIADGTISNTEFQYLDGATSNLQAQIALKADAAYIYDLTGGTTGQLMAKASDTNGDFEWKSITDYLNNTLTSTSTLVGLTAAKGKELKDLVDTNNGLAAHLAGTETFTGDKNFTGASYFSGGILTGGSGVVNLQNTQTILRGYPDDGTVKGTVITGSGPGATITFTPSGLYRYLTATPTDITYNGTSLLGKGNNTLLTGYTKPGSTSAVSATDNVNEAIGKLEKAADEMAVYKMDPRTGSETLVSADILPTTTRQKAVWMTYSTNDTITLDNTLPIGVPFILEAGADSLMVKRSAGTIDFYGEGNSSVRQSADIDGLIIAGGKSITGIKKKSNEYRFDGAWTVRNAEVVAPTNLYDPANSASPIAEANATTGINKSTNVTLTSDSSKKSNGSYSIKSVASVGDEWVYILRPSSLTAGTYDVSFDVAKVGGFTNNSITTSTSNQWSATSTASIDDVTGNFKTYTLTGIVLTSITNSDSGRLRFYIDDTSEMYIDNIIWTAH